MQRVLQLSVTLLVCIAGTIFACAEGAPLAGITVLVAILTLFFIDWDNSFAVPPFIANGLGVLAFIAAAAEFFSGAIEARLLSGGHLIVYLTWVFLLQRKENRHYWWLCALSVLQVAVAAVLTSRIWYGFALVSYSFVACWTLSVFQMWRATKTGQVTKVDQQQPRLIVGTAQKGIARDVDHRLLDGRFFRTTTLVFCLSMVMTVLFFLFTPRAWIGNYNIYGDAPTDGRKLTGFSDEVRLGDMGEILENNASVARIQFYREDSGRRLTRAEAETYLGPEPLFRGGAQESYEDGHWSREIRERVTDPHEEPGFIRQEIQLEPIGVPTLFGFGNIVRMDSQYPGTSDDRESRSPSFYSISSVFRRATGRGWRDRRYRYKVIAQQGLPDTLFAEKRRQWPPYGRRFWYFDAYLKQARAVPPELRTLRDLSQPLVRDAVGERDAAERLQSYLRDSEEFSYSLTMNTIDPTIDPIEDFLINRKQGHCEYFASALTMLLRSVGIPARMVTGFKGGFFEEDTLVIQQLHAHSWVEAYIDGRWQTFDPTPGTRDESVATRQGAPSLTESLKAQISDYWNTGVRMSSRQQQELLYKPFAELARSTGSLFRGDFSGLKDRLARFRSPREWISIQGGIIAFVLLLFLCWIVWVSKKLLHLILAFLHRSETAAIKRPQVEFYNRFLKAMQQLGVQQLPTQTAREFVQQSLVSLESRLPDTGQAAWPADIAEKFYQVRFGNQPLTDAESAELDRHLSQLEDVLQPSPIAENAPTKTST